MQKSYKLSPQASADLKDIFLFGLENWGLKQADAYAEQIIACFDLLNKNPDIGIQRVEFCDNILSFVHASHIIFYRKINSTIEIAGIIHQKADIQQRFKP